MLSLQDNEPEYPSSDGKPMAESDLHRQRMVDLIEALKCHYQGQEVYVSGNLLLYYERGNPKACLSPDVLVTLDRPSHPREIYKLWEEGKAPELVIEVTSKSTRKKDTHHKKALYEMLGVQEYLLFDPRGDYLDSRFQVYRRAGAQFLEGAGADQEAAGAEKEALRAEHEAARAEHEAARAEQEAARAEQEAARAEQEAARAEQAAMLAQQEALRAEKEAARAEQEAARAERAEAELNRLRALLQQSGQQP